MLSMNRTVVNCYRTSQCLQYTSGKHGTILGVDLWLKGLNSQWVQILLYSLVCLQVTTGSARFFSRIKAKRPALTTFWSPDLYAPD